MECTCSAGNGTRLCADCRIGVLLTNLKDAAYGLVTLPGKQRRKLRKALIAGVQGLKPELQRGGLTSLAEHLAVLAEVELCLG